MVLRYAREIQFAFVVIAVAGLILGITVNIWFVLMGVFSGAASSIFSLLHSRAINRRIQAMSPLPLWQPGDSITTTPINNPLDFRADGSILRGDPGWEIWERLQNGGGAVIANQREDGTWDIQDVGLDD